MTTDTLSPTPPQSYADETALQTIAKLVDLLCDPVAAAARVQQLLNAIAEQRTTLDAVATQTADLDTKRQAMNDERAAHDAKLTSERRAFDNECAAMRNKLTEAQNAAAAAKAEATAARERSVVLNNDLETRLSVIHGAATAPLPARH